MTYEKNLLANLSNLIHSLRIEVQFWKDKTTTTQLLHTGSPITKIFGVELQDIQKMIHHQPQGFQGRVRRWVELCFGVEEADDKQLRGLRFLEEALELVQAGGISKAHAINLVEYVYSRPVGKFPQEVGGVMTTLAALCEAHCVGMYTEGDKELERVNSMIDVIREKSKKKPSFNQVPELWEIKNLLFQVTACSSRDPNSGKVWAKGMLGRWVTVNIPGPLWRLINEKLGVSK